MSTNIILQIAASQAVATGLMLENADHNPTGKEHVIGEILVAGGNAAAGFLQNNDGKLNAAMRAIRDAADSYLQSQGSSPAPQS